MTKRNLKTLSLERITPKAAAFLTRYARLAGGHLDISPGSYRWDAALDMALLDAVLHIPMRFGMTLRAVKCRRRRAALALRSHALGLNRGQYQIKDVTRVTHQDDRAIELGILYAGHLPSGYTAYVHRFQTGQVTVYLLDRPSSALTEAPLCGSGVTLGAAIRNALLHGDAGLSPHYG